MRRVVVVSGLSMVVALAVNWFLAAADGSSGSIRPLTAEALARAFGGDCLKQTTVDCEDDPFELCSANGCSFVYPNWICGTAVPYGAPVQARDTWSKCKLQPPTASYRNCPVPANVNCRVKYPCKSTCVLFQGAFVCVEDMYAEGIPTSYHPESFPIDPGVCPKS